MCMAFPDIHSVVASRCQESNWRWDCGTGCCGVNGILQHTVCLLPEGLTGVEEEGLVGSRLRPCWRHLLPGAQAPACRLPDQANITCFRL